MYTQLLCHLVGDFILQNGWMGVNKSHTTWICLLHVIIYTSVFLILTTSWKALLFIGVTHFIIDRWKLPAKFCTWKNSFGTPTIDGKPIEIPDYIQRWIEIVNDNTMHLVLNYFALLLLV